MEKALRQSAPRPRAKRGAPKFKCGKIAQIAVIAAFLFFSMVPIYLMAVSSVKANIEIDINFWGLPKSVFTGNFNMVFESLLRPSLNTLIIAAASITGILICSVLSAYAFAVMDFPGKKILFGLILALMMIPGILTVTPNFVLVNNLGLRGTWFSLIFFYVAGGQVMGIFMTRQFIAGIPKEVFESAKIDGASHIRAIFGLAVPLSMPILITIVLMNFMYVYNDFLWPMLVLGGDRKMDTLMIAIQKFQPMSKESNRPDVAVQIAGYFFASVPILIIILAGMKYYVQGISAGAVKG
jgi:ABC-type glycerol-3-phosphate transport system permease component